MTDMISPNRPAGAGRPHGLAPSGGAGPLAPSGRAGPLALLARPNLLALLAGLGMLAAGWRVALPALLGLRGGVAALDHAALYNRTVIATSYVGDGFVRRGLAGTIVHLWPVGWTAGAVLFTLLSVAWLAVPLALLVRRIAPHPDAARTVLLAAVIVASPQTFLGWAADIGRTDLFAAGFVVWAAVAASGLHLRLAIVAILAGTLVHEVALVFGGALLAALFAVWVGSRRLSYRSAALHLGALVAGAAILALLQARFAASPLVVAGHMMASGPAPADAGQLETKAIATYMQVAGSRGLRTAMCFNARGGASYALWALANLAVLAVYIPILGLRRHLAAFALAGLLPAAVLLVVANDAGRWIQLGVLNAWLLAVVLHHWHPAGRASRAGIGIAVVALLALLPFGTAKLDRADALPAYLVDALSTGGGEGFQAMIAHCDPRWTEVLPQTARGVPGDAPAPVLSPPPALSFPPALSRRSVVTPVS